jgi:hypothetical protein
VNRRDNGGGGAQCNGESGERPTAGVHDAMVAQSDQDAAASPAGRWPTPSIPTPGDHSTHPAT